MREQEAYYKTYLNASAKYYQNQNRRESLFSTLLYEKLCKVGEVRNAYTKMSNGMFISQPKYL